MKYKNKSKQKVIESKELFDSIRYIDANNLFLPLFFQMLSKTIAESDNIERFKFNVDMLEVLMSPMIEEDDEHRVESFNYVIRGENKFMKIKNAKPVDKQYDEKYEQFFDEIADKIKDVDRARQAAILATESWHTRRRLAELIKLLDSLGLYFERRATLWMIDPEDLSFVSEEIIEEEKKIKEEDKNEDTITDKS